MSNIKISIIKILPEAVNDSLMVTVGLKIDEGGGRSSRGSFELQLPAEDLTISEIKAKAENHLYNLLESVLAARSGEHLQ